MAKKNKKNINEMTFLDHLEELRWLLVRSSAAILTGGAVGIEDSIFTVTFLLLIGIIFYYRAKREGKIVKSKLFKK